MQSHRICQCFPCKSFPSPGNKYKICSGCLKVAYCSFTCQAKDLVRHKPLCAEFRQTTNKRTLERVLSSVPLAFIADMQSDLPTDKFVSIVITDEEVELLQSAEVDMEFKATFRPVDRLTLGTDILSVVIDREHYVELLVWNGDPTKRQTPSFFVLPIKDLPIVQHVVDASSIELKALLANMKPLSKDDVIRIVKDGGGTIFAASAADNSLHQIVVKALE